MQDVCDDLKKSAPYKKLNPTSHTNEQECEHHVPLNKIDIKVMDVIAIYNASTPTKYPQGAKMVKKTKKIQQECIVGPSK